MRSALFALAVVAALPLAACAGDLEDDDAQSETESDSARQALGPTNTQKKHVGNLARSGNDLGPDNMQKK